MAKKFVKTTTSKWGSMSNEQKSNYSDSIVFIKNDSSADSAIIGAVTNGTYILQDGNLIGGGIDMDVLKSKGSIEKYFDSGGIGLDIKGYISASVGTVPSKTLDGISWVEMSSGDSGGSETTIEYTNGSIDMKGGQIFQNGTVILDDSGNLSSATTSRVGGIKVSSVNTTPVTVNSESTTSGRYYPIVLNSDGKAIVNVPWTIPTVNNGTLTMQVGGVQKQTFGANQSTNVTFDVPSATSEDYGVVKVSSVNSTDITAQAGSTVSNRYYSVELNKNGKAIVNVPWVNSLNCDYRTTTNSSATTSVELAPNIFRKFSNALLANLSITLGSATSTTTVNEYLVEFSFGSTLYTVSFPSTIKWADNKTPVFKANKTYQISIVNDLATYLEF